MWYSIIMIPSSITKLFWDSDPNILDLEKHKKSIIARTLNYGTLGDWKWLKDKYGNDAITEVTLLNDSAGRTSVRVGAQRLAKIIFT